MPITTLPIYATGDTIQAITPNTLMADVSLLDGRTGGDPGTIGKMLGSGSALGGQWLSTLPARYVDNQALGDGAVDARVISDGTVGTAELGPQAVTSAKMAPNAAQGNLGYRPVNATGDSMSNTLTIARDLGANQVFDGLILSNPNNSNSGAGMQLNTPSGGTRVYHQYQSRIIGVNDLNGTVAFEIRYGESIGRVYGKVLIDSGNIGSQAVNDSSHLGGVISSSYARLDALANFTGGITANGASLITSASIATQHVALADSATTATALTSPIGNIGAGTGAGNIAYYDGGGRVQDSGRLGGIQASTTPGPSRIPISDATGTLNTWVTGSGIGVPSGLMAGWDSASTIPTDWTRVTAADGLLLVGAGTSFSQTFSRGSAYGSAWLHQHAATGLTGTSTFSGTATATLAPSASNGLAAAGGVNLPTDTHTHSHTPAGTVSTTLSGNVQNTTWLPPMYAVIWIRKN